jgi:hypothetical protein
VAVKRRELLLVAVLDAGGARVGGLFKLLPRVEERDADPAPALPERELRFEARVLDFVVVEVAGMPRFGGTADDVKPRFARAVVEDFVAVGEEGCDLGLRDFGESDAGASSG